MPNRSFDQNIADHSLTDKNSAYLLINSISLRAKWDWRPKGLMR